MRQAGATLLIALVLTALLTIGAAATLRFASSGLRVAVNEELRSDAFQRAQSLVDDVLADPLNLMLDDDLAVAGETNCISGLTGCSHTSLVVRDEYGTPVVGNELAYWPLPSSDPAAQPALVRVVLRRIDPLVSTPPRNTGYSAVKFQSSFLQVESGYDGTSYGRGKATLNEGVAVIVPYYGR